MENIINQIVDLEWEQFKVVQNIGGRADCQNNYSNFYIMRYSNFSFWPEKILHDYISVLEKAKNHNRNILAEKYGYMLKSTDIFQYNLIKDKLPSLSESLVLNIDKIWKIEREWALELIGKYPKLMGLGRTLDSTNDSIFSTSIETYFKSELCTYGDKIVDELLKYYQKSYNEGTNLHEISSTTMVRLKGYSSLEEAENSIE